MIFLIAICNLGYTCMHNYTTLETSYGISLPHLSEASPRLYLSEVSPLPLPAPACFPTKEERAEPISRPPSRDLVLREAATAMVTLEGGNHTIYISTICKYTCVHQSCKVAHSVSM